MADKSCATNPFARSFLVTHLLLFAIVLSCSASQPDLTIWAPTVSPRIAMRSFISNGCDVIEGCANPGTRRLLAFGTEARNVGSTNLVLGRPENNPLFEFARCHGHYHFSDFAYYNLLGSTGEAVANQTKAGFCLEDSFRWNTNAPGTNRFDCINQGIQAGWSDFYDWSLSCQSIDITALAPGVYTLNLEVDPLNHIPESNEMNNVTELFVVINPPCTNAPANDAFANASALEGGTLTVVAGNSCGTREPGEPQHHGNRGGSSIWYRWVPDYTGNALITTLGSTFDTLLAVYHGSALGSLTLIASSNDVAPEVRWSRVNFLVTNGAPVMIAIDGYNGGTGGLALNINPVANDHFTNALQLAGSRGALNFINIGATTEAGEPSHGNHSLWYRWTAPASGPVRVHSHGSSIDTFLAIYEGTDLANLIDVAANDDASGLKSSAALFEAVAGRSYAFAITGAEGFIALTWEPAPVPRVVSMFRVDAGNYLLSIAGQTEDRYIIEHSVDLQAWQTVGTTTNRNGTATYEATAPASQGFYRAILVP